MSMKRANSTTKFVHSWSRFGKPDPWAQENRARVPNVQATHFLCKAFSEPASPKPPKADLYPGRKGNLIDIDRSIDAVDLDRGGHDSEVR